MQASPSCLLATKETVLMSRKQNRCINNIKRDSHHSGCPSYRIRLFYQFFNFGLLAYPVSQVVQFGSSYFTFSYQLNLLYIGRVQRPCLLNADAVGALSYGKGSSVAAALLFQDNTFKYLDSFTVTFFDFTLNSYGITNGKFRNLLLQLFLFNCLNNVVHCSSS